MRRWPLPANDDAPGAPKGTVTVVLELRGGRLGRQAPFQPLSEIDSVTAVKVGDAGLVSD